MARDKITDWEEVPIEDWEDVKEPSKSADMVNTDAALKGLQQGATFGFADELSGAVDAGLALGERGLNAVGLSDNQVFTDKPISEVYAEGRDAVRAQQAQAEKESPGSYALGNLAGAVATAPVGGASIKGMGAVGALSGLGDTEQTTATGMATDTALGAAGGMIVGKALDKASKIKEVLKKKAEELSRSALGYTKSMIKAGPEKSREIARQALDRGIVTPKKDVDDMVRDIQNLKSISGKELEDVAKEVHSLGIQVDSKGVADNLKASMSDYSNQILDPSLTAKFNRAMTAIEEQGKTPEGMRALRDQISKRAAWNKNAKDISPTESMYRDIWKSLQDNYSQAVEMAATEIKDPRLMDRLSKAKSDYRFAAEAEKALLDKQAKEAANQGLGWTNLGMAGLATGGDLSPSGLAKGAAAGFGLKYARKKGASVAASGLDHMAKALEKSGKYGDLLRGALARGGKNAATATYNVLMQKDEGFRKSVMEDGEE